MRDPLTLAVAQPPTAPYDVGRNALAHAAAVRAAAARVVVFPELSLTGYELDASAITPGDPRLAPILDACAETGTTALVGAPVQGERGRPYIAMLAVDDGGARVAYRKMHLGGDEPDRYAPGAAPAVLEVAGWRLGLAICRDTGVGGHAAETVALGVDAYVAGTVKLPQESALQDSRAERVAVEQRIWVAVASFAGATGGGFAPAAGRSGIWAPGGRLVARAGTEPGDLVRAELR